MPHMGRPPTPTRMKELAGNPGRRPINQEEPQSTPVLTLEPPAWLDKKAQAAWRRRAPAVVGMRVLTDGDLAAFEFLCELDVEIAEYAAIIRKDGRTTKTGAGTPKVHPLEQPLSDRRKMRVELWSKFGMTPSDRTRLKVEPPKPEDPADEFMKPSGGGRVN